MDPYVTEPYRQVKFWGEIKRQPHSNSNIFILYVFVKTFFFIAWKKKGETKKVISALPYMNIRWSLLKLTLTLRMALSEKSTITVSYRKKYAF